MTKKQFKSLVWLLILLALDAYFVFSRLYFKFEFIDLFLHFGGGFFIAMFLVDYLELSNHQRLKKIFILTSTVILVGVFWEFAEYIMSRFFDLQVSAYLGSRYSLMGDISDTLLDLAMDFLGALTFSLAYLNPLTPGREKESARQP